MSHEISIVNGKAEMAFIGSRSNIWQGLGQQLTEDAGLDVWRVEAGMDWLAKASPLAYMTENPGRHYYNGKRVLFRADNDAPLGIVSDRYNIVQPDEVLEFFRDLIEGAGFKMETAGVLFGGKKLCALAKVGESVKIGGIDEIKPYLLVGTSLDGSMATVAHFTATRVVCNNTLRMAIGANGKKAKIRVPHSKQFDASSVKDQIGIAQEVWHDFVEECETLSSIKLTRDEAITIAAEELDIKFDDDLLPPMMVQQNRTLDSILKLFDGTGMGANLATANGTGWGLVNAFTQWADHDSISVRSDKSRSVDRAQFGDRATLKTNVADRLLKDFA